MRLKSLSILLIIVSAALMSTLSAAGDETALKQSSKFYEDYINKCISRCRTKVTLFKNLKLNNIQKMASEAEQMAAFLSENKDGLVQEMVAKNIGKKHYKVKLYLNKRFKESNSRDINTPLHAFANIGR